MLAFITSKWMLSVNVIRLGGYYVYRKSALKSFIILCWTQRPPEGSLYRQKIKLSSVSCETNQMQSFFPLIELCGIFGSRHLKLFVLDIQPIQWDAHETISGVYREWSEKEEQMSGRKCLADVRGKKRTAKLF